MSDTLIPCKTCASPEPCVDPCSGPGYDTRAEQEVVCPCGADAHRQGGPPKEVTVTATPDA